MLKHGTLIALAFLLLAGCGGLRTLSSGPPANNSVLNAPEAPGAQPMFARDGPLLNSNNFISRFAIPSPMGFAWFEALGSDGNVWFTEENVHKVGRITPTGTFTEFPIAASVRGQGIAAGTPGFLWFAAAGKIGRITTAGAISMFTISGTARNAVGITKGPDGNMWFADAAGAIGRITPAGVIREFTVPTASSGPMRIATGPDGNLWFTEFSAGKVGKITTAAVPVITEFALPTHASGPNSIVAGPDGNLYVSELNSSKLAKVTTAGSVTEFTAPSAIQTLVVGPDNQIWMTFHTQGNISEFNRTTHVFSPVVPIPNGPTGNLGLSLVQGSNHDIWLGDSNDKIDVYEESVQPVGVRLTGEAAFVDPHYGSVLGYFNGLTSTTSQVVSLTMGESVQFTNVDTMRPHTVSFLGTATATHAPWPPSFNGSASQSPAGTVISTTNFSTGPLNPGQQSLIYETGLPGFFMIGCAFHYDSNGMRSVIIVR